ncbi:unnamed protein product [Ambrosiozyma monospora]|uniref:Unnamed protein product n=1 Tax=Ambrosiozyma monospora TaxID=43982 RepID=A0A9W6YV67_AMBMO|nr:unnamed protein product [Ambrosiozyma monospora]
MTGSAASPPNANQACTDLVPGPNQDAFASASSVSTIRDNNLTNSNNSNTNITNSTFPPSSQSNSRVNLLDEELDSGLPSPALTAEALEHHKKAIASIAPILEDFVPVLSKSEFSPHQTPVSRTVSNVSNLEMKDTSHSHNLNAHSNLNVILQQHQLPCIYDWPVLQ